MADDPVSAELAALKGAWEEACTAAHGGSATEKPLLTAARLIKAGDGLAKALAALDAVLALHRPVLNVMYEGDRCTECRDRFGDPVPFAECRARKAALAALTGKAAS